MLAARHARRYDDHDGSHERVSHACCLAVNMGGERAVWLRWSHLGHGVLVWLRAGDHCPRCGPQGLRLGRGRNPMGRCVVRCSGGSSRATCCCQTNKGRRPMRPAQSSVCWQNVERRSCPSEEAKSACSHGVMALRMNKKERRCYCAGTACRRYRKLLQFRDLTKAELELADQSGRQIPFWQGAQHSDVQCNCIQSTENSP